MEESGGSNQLKTYNRSSSKGYLCGVEKNNLFHSPLFPGEVSHRLNLHWHNPLSNQVDTESTKQNIRRVSRLDKRGGIQGRAHLSTPKDRDNDEDLPLPLKGGYKFSWRKVPQVKQCKTEGSKLYATMKG